MVSSSPRLDHIVRPLSKLANIHKKINSPNLRVKDLKAIKDETIVLMKTPLLIDGSIYVWQESKYTTLL